MKVWDCKHQLRLEISENEQRKELTHSERVAYGREVERIEGVKARENSKANLKQNADVVERPTRDNQGRVREIVADAVGYGG